MKKLLILGCILLFVCCMAKKAAIKTEGLEEVVVFGEDTTQAPAEEPFVPPIVPPSVTEEALVPPPVVPPALTEIAEAPPAVPPVSLSEEPVITLPPAPEVAVAPPPMEEVAVVPPPTVEVPGNLPTEEVAALPPALPPASEVAAALPSLPPVPEVASAPPPAAVPSGPQGSVYGFRVQIFASSTERNAMKIVDDARAAFSGRVYVEHVAPYYKVRIGDCLTREDAEALKTKAVSLGYRGAFIVETMINP